MTPRWVSWKKGRNFILWHLEGDGHTLCGLDVPRQQLVARTSQPAKVKELCQSCLSVFARQLERQPAEEAPT